MLFDMQKMVQCQLPQVLIKSVQSENILKSSSIPIVFCCWILEKILIASNQSEISNLPKYIFGTIFICNNQVFIPQFLYLLIICHKWFWHWDTPGYCK